MLPDMDIFFSGNFVSPESFTIHHSLRNAWCHGGHLPCRSHGWNAGLHWSGILDI